MSTIQQSNITGLKGLLSYLFISIYEEPTLVFSVILKCTCFVSDSTRMYVKSQTL